jgi:hypothetical protein
LNSIVHLWFSNSITFFLICSIWCIWFFRFLSGSIAIRLSVNICTVLSSVSKYCMFSSAFNIASFSAWLFRTSPVQSVFICVCYFVVFKYNNSRSYSSFTFAAVCVYMNVVFSAFSTVSSFISGVVNFNYIRGV